MDTVTFRYIWEEGIKKAAQNVVEEIPLADKEKYNVKLDVSNEMCEQVHQIYENVKSNVRESFFNAGEGGENKIDGHKICACITATMLKIRLVSFNTNSVDLPKKIVYSNYAIAFLASIYTMYLFLLSDYEREGESACYNELIKQSTFHFPRTTPGHDSYVQGRIKTLALNNIQGRDFDILTYADMLFWIEKYNKTLILEAVNKKD